MERPREPPVRLVLLGPHTRLVADLCAACPQGATGCCSAPPDLSWADLGRVVALGGLDWVLAELGEGRLLAGPRGLVVRRVASDEPASGATKCVYHGELGCTLTPDLRSAACNYYLCKDALATSGDDGFGVEAAGAAWTTQYAAWNEELSIDLLRGWEASVADGGERALLVELGRRFSALASG